MSSQINPRSMLAISTALPALSIIAVAMKFYIRLARRKGEKGERRQGLGVDDWLILPAVLLLVGMGIAIIIGVERGAVGVPLGTNDITSASQAVVLIEQIEWATFMLSTLDLGLIKLSILFFYRRVFLTGSNRAFDWVTKILIVLVIMWTIAFFFDFLFDCRTDFWIHWASYSTYLKFCGDATPVNLASFISEFLLDLILFILPIFPVWQLHVSVGRRLAILLVFALGALAVVTSIIKLVIYALIISGDHLGNNSFVHGDQLIIVSLYLYWTIFGCGVGVLVACLPTLQIWFRKVTVDAISKNVRGIFSVVSLERGSRGSRGGQRSGSEAVPVVKDTNSSTSGHLDKIDSMELATLSGEPDMHHEGGHAHTKWLADGLPDV